MKARIRKDVGIDIIAETKAEFDVLIKIWHNQGVVFEKSGCCIYNCRIGSAFLVKFLKKEKKRASKAEGEA